MKRYKKLWNGDGEWHVCSWEFSSLTSLCKICSQIANRELKQRRFWATDVNRQFMFSLLARFHARTMSYKALILAFTTWLFEWKGCNTHQRGEVSTSGWRPWLKNVNSGFQYAGYLWRLKEYSVFTTDYHLFACLTARRLNCFLVDGWQ